MPSEMPLTDTAPARPDHLHCPLLRRNHRKRGKTRLQLLACLDLTPLRALCKPSDVSEDILDLNITSVSPKFFVTGRPELPTRLCFQEISGSYDFLALHNIPNPVIEHDISSVLEVSIGRYPKTVLPAGSGRLAQRSGSPETYEEDHTSILCHERHKVRTGVLDVGGGGNDGAAPGSVYARRHDRGAENRLGRAAAERQ